MRLANFDVSMLKLVDPFSFQKGERPVEYTVYRKDFKSFSEFLLGMREAYTDLQTKQQDIGFFDAEDDILMMELEEALFDNHMVEVEGGYTIKPSPMNDNDFIEMLKSYMDDIPVLEIKPDPKIIKILYFRWYWQICNGRRSN